MAGLDRGLVTSPLSFPRSYLECRAGPLLPPVSLSSPPPISAKSVAYQLPMGTAQGFPAVANGGRTTQEGQSTPPWLSGFWETWGNSKIITGPSQSHHALPPQSCRSLTHKHPLLLPIPSAQAQLPPEGLGGASLMTPSTSAPSPSEDCALVTCAT